MTEQLTLDLRRWRVVPNHWGPVYHICDEGRMAAQGSPSLFRSIDDAVSWAKGIGLPVEVPEQTRDRWAHWTAEQVEKYHAYSKRTEALA